MTHIPALVAETAETVTLARTDWEAMIEALEEADDLRAMAGIAAERAAGTLRTLPGTLVARLVEGDHPVRVWREYRGLSLTALAAQAAVSVSYLSEIETGRKPGSTTCLHKLAGVLDVTIDDLLRRQRP